MSSMMSCYNLLVPKVEFKTLVRELHRHGIEAWHAAVDSW